MSPVSLHMDSAAVCLGGAPGLWVAVDCGAGRDCLSAKDKREDAGLSALSIALGPTQ